MVSETDIRIERIMASLQQVMDPEIPVLSVTDLGIIEEVIITDDAVTVLMLPTFTACPAIKMMQAQIREKVMQLGYAAVTVNVVDTIAWNSDRMSAEAKEKLEAFGLATPFRHGGTFDLDAISQSKCPHCGSANTTMSSMFGSTLCRSMHFCFDCRQGFERFKPL